MKSQYRLNNDFTLEIIAMKCQETTEFLALLFYKYCTNVGNVFLASICAILAQCKNPNVESIFFYIGCDRAMV